ncbi:hypothetical protein HU200_027365 [Digitaria exilis]|uniref:RING-type E3 ubiquitin transferase n=1 Tax=Digitaria exilis TaxID=1010633 RepID=A0A835C7A2_9POAL|nr:hypothetical protein HU200_027365 [Digitaria exilis]
MASSPQDVVDAGSTNVGVPPVAPWWSAASPVGGDVVLSAAVLLFLAVAFAFVVYHYFTVGLARHPCRGAAQVAMMMPSGDHQRRRGTSSRAKGGVDTAALLRALPVTVYRAGKKDDGRAGDEALECAVCLAELVDGEKARFLPRCGHGFHAECVDLWLLRGNPTCPLCRVEVVDDKQTGSFSLPVSSMALPPEMPEPANYYPTNIPTNVLFWGSQDTVATVVGGGATPSRGASAAVVIELRETTPAAAALARGGEGEGKAQGLARLSSLRRLWSRGRRDEAVAASSRPCRHAATAAAADGTEPARAAALHIWNLT